MFPTYACEHPFRTFQPGGLCQLLTRWGVLWEVATFICIMYNISHNKIVATSNNTPHLVRSWERPPGQNVLLVSINIITVTLCCCSSIHYQYPLLCPQYSYTEKQRKRFKQHVAFHPHYIRRLISLYRSGGLEEAWFYITAELCLDPERIKNTC